MGIDTTVYHGAIRSDSSYGDTTRLENWTLTNDITKLSEAQDDEVIWTDTIEGLVDVLKERHQHQSGIPCVVGHHCGASVWPHPVVKFSDELPRNEGPWDPERDKERRSRIDEIRYEQIMSAVKVSGTICVIDHYGSIPMAVYDECIVTQGGRVIEYAPQKAQKKKAQEQRKSLTRPVSAYTIYRCLYELNKCTGTRINQPDISGNLSRADYFHGIRKSLWLFETVFGKGSFRKTEFWHSFVKEWKELQGPTEKQIAKDNEKLLKNAHPDHVDNTTRFVKQNEEFVAFMAIEVKKRLPKALAKEEILKLGVEITLPGTPKKAKSCESDSTANKSVAIPSESGTL